MKSILAHDSLEFAPEGRGWLGQGQPRAQEPFPLEVRLVGRGVPSSALMGRGGTRPNEIYLSERIIILFKSTYHGSKDKSRANLIKHRTHEFVSSDVHETRKTYSPSSVTALRPMRTTAHHPAGHGAATDTSGGGSDAGECRAGQPECHDGCGEQRAESGGR